MKYLQVFLLFFVLALFVNCTPKVVPVERVKIDSVFIAQYLRDTIYEKDSAFVYKISDTVYKERYRYLYRDRVIADTTLKKHSGSTIKVKEVEKHLTKMQQLKMDIGSGVLWAIPIILCLYLLYRKFLR